MIVFEVDEARVAILGVFYGGRDYEALLEADLDDPTKGDKLSPEQAR